MKDLGLRPPVLPPQKKEAKMDTSTTVPRVTFDFSAAPSLDNVPSFSSPGGSFSAENFFSQKTSVPLFSSTVKKKASKTTVKKKASKTTVLAQCTELIVGNGDRIRLKKKGEEGHSSIMPAIFRNKIDHSYGVAFYFLSLLQHIEYLS